MILSKFTTAPRYKKDGTKRSYPQDFGISLILHRWLRLNPKSKLKWLDVCCGSGRILETLAENKGDYLNRIEYYGYDISNDFLRLTEKTAEKVGISCKTKVGRIDDLNKYFSGQEFALISIINSLHELPLTCVPELFLTLLKLCQKDGSIYLFDLTRVPYDFPEPGAITWNVDTINKILYDLECSFIPQSKTQAVYSQKFWCVDWEVRHYKKDFKNLINRNQLSYIQILEKRIKSEFISRLKQLDRNLQEEIFELWKFETQLNQIEHRNVRLETLTNKLEYVQVFLDELFRDFWSCIFELNNLHKKDSPY